MKNISVIILIIGILLSSCRNDIVEFNSELEQAPPEVFIKNTIRGKVVDESGIPVPNALVDVNGTTTVSDFDGTFKLNSTSVKKSGNIVKTTSSSYFDGVSHSIFSPDGSSFVEVKMMEKGVAQIINPTIEQSISQANGLKLTIPANSLITPSGQNYSGNSKVYARWIDPTDENIGGIMPGALNATNLNGDERVLSTYGMLALDLEADGGGKLKLKEGAEITAEIPIPDELLNQAPEEMPLWEYDLEEGQWLEKGICYKSGGYYIVSVSQTGYWNCDVPLEAICLSAQVLNADSSYASYIKVIVEDLTDNFIYWGYTDSTGIFCGSVPKAALLKITIEDHCNNVIYMDEIGPYSMDVQLDDIYLSENLSEFFFNVTGSISHCISTDIPQGHLGVRYPGTLSIYPIENAAFDVNVALKCIDFPEIELTVYSTTEPESTISTNINTVTDTDLGLQTTCEELEDSFELNVEGINYFTSPTQHYLKPNQTTNWMTLEGLSGAGKFTLELRDYQGVGEYTENVFFETENNVLVPDFYILNSASPDITVNITGDDGEFISGNFLGFANDNNNETRNISGDFIIRKAP